MLRSEIFPPLQNGKVVLREVDIQGFLDARKIVPEKSLVSFFFTSSRKRSFDQKNTKPGTHKR
jgi:guanylate kinase